MMNNIVIGEDMTVSRLRRRTGERYFIHTRNKILRIMQVGGDKDRCGGDDFSI